MRTMQRLIDYCENTTSCSEDSQEETRVSQLHALLQHVSDVAEAFGLGISKCLKITLITITQKENNKPFMQLTMEISLPGLRYIY